jgi:hypothetical protein
MAQLLVGSFVGLSEDLTVLFANDYGLRIWYDQVSLQICQSRLKDFLRVAVKPNDLSLILKPLLFATCGVYTGLLIGYLYFAYGAWKGKSKKKRFLIWMYLVNGFVCGLILILAAVLLRMCWAQVISADLVLWVSQSRSWKRTGLTLYEDHFPYLWCLYG